MRRTILSFGVTVFLLLLHIQVVNSQTTEFTYQGNLNAAGLPATGSHDFEFLLFDALTTAPRSGPTVVLNAVTVNNGALTVKLNFGNQFTGANRFLEIRVRPSGQGGITILSPRQTVTSSPYSVKSLNAENAAELGGVPANQFILTSDPRLTDARPPTPGSPNYIQNGTSPQAASNFNISGIGTANVFNSTTQYNIGGSRILGNAGTDNLFAGTSAGALTTGARNTFAGHQAGGVNTTGAANSFFGAHAGLRNSFGFTNSFFGESAGRMNLGGAANAFFGNSAGPSNTEGNGNTFLGSGSGPANTTGGSNTFVGIQSGLSNVSGNSNTLVGAATKVNSGDLNFATAIGAQSTALTSNSITLGRSGGEDIVRMPGAVIFETLSTGGVTALCRNAFLLISTCSSSIRYKSDVEPFRPGLNLIARLRPVSFNWKAGGMRDVGLVAEDVAEIEPLLTTAGGKRRGRGRQIRPRQYRLDQRRQRAACTNRNAGTATQPTTHRDRCPQEGDLLKKIQSWNPQTKD